ncbi:MAG: RNA methyltransferase [Sulfolobaceae archaeon]
MSAPKLIVTAKPGKTRKCITEILNVLLKHDQNSSVEEVVSNVLIVNSSLDANLVYGIIISRPPSCMNNIYPIHLILDSNSEKTIINSIKEYFLNNFKEIKNIYCRCYARNVKVDCRVVEIGVGIALKDNVIINYKKPDIIIIVNIVPNRTFISFIRKGQEKVSV